MRLEKELNDNTPPEFKLTPELTEQFTQAMLPIVMKSLFSKSPRLAVSAQQSMRMIACTCKAHPRWLFCPYGWWKCSLRYELV